MTYIILLAFRGIIRYHALHTKESRLKNRSYKHLASCNDVTEGNRL